MSETGLAATFKTFWAARAMRERRILASGAVVLALLLLYFVLVAPALGGLARLQTALPQTRQRAAQLEGLLGEAKGLRRLPVAATLGAGDARGALEKSLEGAGLKAAHSETLPNGDLRLTFAKVPYGKWSGWLALAERTMGVHTVAARIKASAPDAADAGAAAAPSAGNADIELTLHLLRAG